MTVKNPIKVVILRSIVSGGIKKKRRKNILKLLMKKTETSRSHNK